MYVIDREEKAELRAIRASMWRGKEWLIEDGLQPGERVVVEGFYRILPGIQVNAIPYQREKVPIAHPEEQTMRDAP